MSEEGKARNAEKLPDRIVRRMILRIFTGDLKPGERLPPLREFANELGVDRTSLRIALERLSQMNLLSMVQGSGTEILDYREHAGIEFLSAVFGYSYRADDLDHTDLLLELMEFMSVVAPGLVSIASERVTKDQIRRLTEVYKQHLEHLDDLDTLTDLRTQTEDMLATAVDNLIVKLLYKSTHDLRREMNRRILQKIDVKADVQKRIAWLELFGSDHMTGEEIADLFRTHQKRDIADMKAAILETRQDRPTDF